MEYKVSGKTTVWVDIIVEAEDEDAAFEAAYQELSGLTSFCGNGGTDKLVGVYGSNMSIDPSDEIEWETAEPM